MLRERFGVSQRRACRVAGQQRSTQRLDPPTPSKDEQRLRAWLRAFAKARPRWGWRRAAKQALKTVQWSVSVTPSLGGRAPARSPVSSARSPASWPRAEQPQDRANHDLRQNTVEMYQSRIFAKTE
jgi:hypothetical protein